MLFILKCYQPGFRQGHFPGDNQLILDTICFKAPRLRHPFVWRLQLESRTDSRLNPGPPGLYSQKRQLIASASGAEAPKHQRQVAVIG